MTYRRGGGIAMSYPPGGEESPRLIPSRGEVRDACSFCVNSPFFSQFTENSTQTLAPRPAAYYIV